MQGKIFYFAAGFALAVAILLGTVLARQESRYYNPEPGIHHPGECPSCRACMICGKEE